jgi:hypothetical protein
MPENDFEDIIIKSKYKNKNGIEESNSYIKFSNRDSPSNDLKKYNGVTIDQCFSNCNSNSCSGFTYNSNNCILKNNKIYPNGGDLIESINTDLYVKQPGDDMKKLIFDNPIYKSSYIIGNMENSVGYNNDLTTAQEIINSINLNLSQLNYIQNQ